jgi:threonine synthase
VTSTIESLHCSRCTNSYDPRKAAFLCACGSPLLAAYRLDEAARTLRRGALGDRTKSMWRYREVLPGRGEPVTLGEGGTPLHHARRLGATLGLDALYIKDESVNPTGSFKARGLSAAVTVACDLGANRLAAPSAGNAGGALAAYGALAGIPVSLYLPVHTPAPFFAEAEVFGATVRRIEGTIADCGRALVADDPGGSWYDVSTLKEPYRIEGKKTMAYEIVEQMEGRVPDVLVYPTGGGTGLIGMWKAFAEMERLGWIGPQRPRMVSVQATGCAPIVRAWEAGAESAEPWASAATFASGLLVPSARGDFLILRALRKSGGTAIAVTDDEMRAAVLEMGRTEGIHAAPEGGATLAALRRLIEAGKVALDETVVLFNTGTGLKYPAAA